MAVAGAGAAVVRWPRVLSPPYLAALIRRQKHPLSALHLFLTAPSLDPSYRHNSQVICSLSSHLISSPSLSPLLPSLLLQSNVLFHKMIIAHFNGKFHVPLPSSLSSHSPPLSDSLFASIISSPSLPLVLSLSLFLSLPHTTCVSWTQSFHSILSELVSHGQFNTAAQIFLKFSLYPQVKIGSETLDLIISALLRVDRPNLALEVFSEYSHLCCLPDERISRTLIKGLIRARMIDEAMHLFYSVMRNYNGDSVIIMSRTVIEALCEEGRVREAEQVLSKAIRKVRRKGRRLEEVREIADVALIAGGVRTIVGYEAIVRDLHEEERFVDAQKVFDEMKAKGFVPSVEMYESKIGALCKIGRINEAIEVFEVEMVERDCVPSTEVYNLVIEVLCKRGESMRALNYLKNMNRKPFIAGKETFEILIDGLCVEDRFVEASLVLDRMVKKRFRPKREAFNRVIQGLCSVGKSFDSVLWLEEMVAHGETPADFVWDSLVSVFCGNKNLVVNSP